MKKTFALMAGVAIALMASSARATVYNDATGDTFLGPNPHILDILSVEVTDDGTNINFKVNVTGDPVAVDWGKYMVMIDSVPGGDSAGNGWNRPISWGPIGADYWLGSWVDNGNGAENYRWTGVWGLPQDASYTNGLISTSKTSSSVTITTGLSRLGLGPNQQFCFDVFSSGGGGGDGAVDSVGNQFQQIANWGDASTAVPVCYTTTPEPGSLALLAMGAAAIIRRRR